MSDIGKSPVYPTTVKDDIERALKYLQYPENGTMRTVAIRFLIVYTDGEKEYQRDYRRDARHGRHLENTIR